MPNVTVTSLKKENDVLKAEIATFRRGFENLQQTLTRKDAQKSGNGGEASCSITKDEALNTLQFYGNAYDDLCLEADKSLKQLWSHLNVLTSRVDEIGNAIDEIKRYSYQYNVKVVGLPEIDPRESASNTTSLCISLLKASEVDINNQTSYHWPETGYLQIYSKNRQRSYQSKEGSMQGFCNVDWFTSRIFSGKC